MERRKVYFDLCDYGVRCVKKENYFFKLLSERYDLELSTVPDFLLHSFGTATHTLHSCTKIYYTPETDYPTFKGYDYAISTHYIDDPRHLRVPYYMPDVKAETLIKQPGEWNDVPARKTKFCAFVTGYANRKTRVRTEFFKKLNARKRVDSAGRALNNMGYNIPFNQQAKREFLEPYKFFMSFENEAVPGYVSEKLTQAMRGRCIPIYYGCPRVAEEFNPKSFINYHDFPNEDALIDYILEVDRNDELYMQYLKEPFFHGNTPNATYNTERIFQFFDNIFNSTKTPVAARKHFFGPWTFVKAVRAQLPAAK